jgi:uncharacterized protein (DUF1330 family)
MLDKEFKYYIDNQKELVKKYENQYLVIRGEEVVGVFGSDEQAYIDSIKKYPEGTFLIQFCDSGDRSYSQTFHSRVSFS